MTDRVRRIARHAVTSCIAIFALSLVATPGVAQEENRTGVAQEKQKSLPVLGGHHFLISAEVPDPFITSYIRNATGGGIAFNVQNLLTDSSGDTILNAEGNIAFLQLGFEYQGALADWVALRVGFEGAARVGTSLESLLGNGVSAVYGYFLGGSFRLAQTEKIALTATADFTGNSITDVGILALVQEAIDTGELPDSTEVVETGTDKAAVGGARFAWAASRLIGVRLDGSIGIADLFRSSEDTKFSFLAGGAVGFNFHDTSNVPLGLLAFFKAANFSPGASNIADAIYTGGVEVDYTGYDDLGLGLTFAWSRIPVANSDVTINTFNAAINLRFFF